MKKQKIAVIGTGNMGTAMAQVFAENGHQVEMWSIEMPVLKEISKRHTNKKYLPGVKLNKNISTKPSYVECIKGADVVLLAVPSVVMPKVIKLIRSCLIPGMIIFSVSKGLDAKTLRSTAEQILNDLPKNLRNSFVKMTGPAVAHEFARQSPTAVEVSSLSKASARKIKNILENEYFKVSVSSDLRGAAMCGSLKNVYAILLGIADGLGWTLNTKSLIFTMAAHEMQIILKKIGADPATAVSLSGIGDLSVTGFNPKSRNVRYGKLLAKGKVKSPRDLGMTQVAEGYFATPLYAKLMRKKKIKAPLIFLTDDILKKKKPPKKGLTDFIKNLSL